MSKHTIAKKITASEPKKKKRWIAILSSREFNNVEIGETLCVLPDEILGRKIVANLMYLTNDPKKQHVNIKFKANEIKGDKVASEMIGYELSNSYVKRAARKGRNKIDESFVVKTKDNINLKIKPLMITRHKTKGSILSELRKRTKEFISNAAQQYTYSEMIGVIVQNRLQRDLRLNLSKTYPLAVCEIRMIERL